MFLLDENTMLIVIYRLETIDVCGRINRGYLLISNFISRVVKIEHESSKSIHILFIVFLKI